MMRSPSTYDTPTRSYRCVCGGYCCFSHETFHTATASFSRSCVVPGLGNGGGNCGVWPATAARKNTFSHLIPPPIASDQSVHVDPPAEPRRRNKTYLNSKGARSRR